MKIKRILQEKEQFLPPLLLGDEQESMIMEYLNRGELYVMGEEKTICGVAVVTMEGKGVCELKNLAVVPELQRKGYGSALVRYLFKLYGKSCHTMLVGTGDSPLTVPFYQSLGFIFSHVEKDFFLLHYDHPIWEAGKQLKDMLYFQKKL